MISLKLFLFVNLKFKDKIENLLCFKPSEQLNILLASTNINNKKMFELESEYTRMGVPNNEWAAVNVNSSYEMCDTYVNTLRNMIYIVLIAVIKFCF